MCFIVKQDYRVKIANKDIICYKTGYLEKNKNEFHSEYRSFIYKKNKLYKRNCLTLNKYRYNISLFRGFHSFQNKRMVLMNRYKKDELKSIKFIIPKGSKYMINWKEYISNQIIWKS